MTPIDVSTGAQPAMNSQRYANILPFQTVSALEVAILPSTSGCKNLGRNWNSSVCKRHFTPLILPTFMALLVSATILAGPQTKTVPKNLPSEACCFATFSNQAVMLSWLEIPLPKSVRQVGENLSNLMNWSTQSWKKTVTPIRSSIRLFTMYHLALDLHTA